MLMAIFNKLWWDVMTMGNSFMTAIKMKMDLHLVVLLDMLKMKMQGKQLCQQVDDNHPYSKASVFSDKLMQVCFLSRVC